MEIDAPIEDAPVDLDKQIAQRLELARQIFPHAEKYSCEPLGLEDLPLKLPPELLSSTRNASTFVLKPRSERSAAEVKVGDKDHFESCLKKSHNSVFCLGSALDDLAAFQREFKFRFKNRVSAIELSELEGKERRWLKKLWATCFEFIRTPAKTLKDFSSYAQAVHHSNRSRFLDTLRRSLAVTHAKYLDARIVAEAGTWSKRGALWIKANVTETRLFETMVREVASSVAQAVTACRFADLETMPLEAQWNYIVIVPQFRGRSLWKVAVAIPCRYFFRAKPEFELPQIYTFSVPVEKIDWLDAELPLWATPAASLSLKWIDSTLRFMVRFVAIRYLLALPTVSSSTPELIQHLESHYSRKLSKVTNDAHSAYEELRDFLRSRLKSSLPPVQNGECVLQQLQTWAAAVYPQERGTKGILILNTDTYKEWGNSVISVADQTSGILNGILDSFLPESEATDSSATPV